ncbi:aldose 1-epimerase [Flavobacteriaceae bacterium 3519-10]|nr:aldose 1-epimerase [Flavobacteriaceae bacterium 3519-10]
MEKIKVSDYGITPAGERVEKFTLENSHGMSVEIITFGAIITSLTVPHKAGNLQNVVLGYADPADYFNGNPYYLGAIIGRFGNRIANAEFELEGKKYTLEANDGVNALHGGKNGFHTKVWKAETVGECALKFTYISDDGEEGFPGELAVSVVYTLTDDNALEVSYQAITDKTTVVNLTQHTYFNLSGDLSESVSDHKIKIESGYFLPTDDAMIPTGELRKVENTPFDFRELKTIGLEIDSEDSEIMKGSGYDHTWVLNGEESKSAATAVHERSGRILEVLTTEPGVQFYTGNHLDGKLKNQSGKSIEKRTGFCLETQHFPDSPNQKDFPSVILKPGEVYESKTVFKFSVAR